MDTSPSHFNAVQAAYHRPPFILHQAPFFHILNNHHNGSFDRERRYHLQITGTIFIQVSKADEFRRKHDRSKDSYTVRIDRDFLYGQNREQTKRFLVLHDKEHELFQFRFVQSAIVAAGNEAANVARSLGIDSGVDILNFLKKFFGDYLKEF
ncbi:hypothetical protein FMUND_2139 [Fusarium mundagurra]|uniref:Uncharacterized protein n=1 Tax=Fusarium mundagurra TaxID=1567541 RepID=A0A8H5Z1W5_9HYPO|nr:hypothetical protein FMUND_2139 [Fusarium mundagurra]